MKELEYKDLLVSVWLDADPGFFCARASEEFGRTTLPVKIHLPLDDPRFAGYVQRLEQLTPQELQYVGARLFDSLFQGDILRLYVHLREQMRPSGSGLRIRLRLASSDAARLPWECLYDTRHDSFLGTSPETTLVRFVEQAQETQMAVGLPLKVVIGAQAAAPESRERIEREAARVRQALRSLEGERLIEVKEAGEALGEERLTRSALSRLARDGHVFHLVVEARSEGDRAAVGLVDESGRADFLSGEELEQAFESAAPGLVILTSEPPPARCGTPLAAGLLRSTPALLALSRLGPEDVASRFLDALYRSLAQFLPVDASLAAARIDVAAHFPLESLWLAPALFTSKRDARIFQSKGRAREIYQLSEGRYRRKLRETLDRIWPKPERYTALRLRWIPRKESLSSLVHSADILAKPQDSSDLTRRFQRVLLLGEPGAGKTMTLYRLFYEAAESILSYSAKSPLPFYVSLPEMPAGVNLVSFLAEGLDQELFASDLEEGRFLFLIDGLDGLSASVAARSMATLNGFMRSYPLNRFVVGTRQPGLLPLNIATWAEFLPLAEWEATDFLIYGDAMRAEQARVLYRELWRNLGPRAGNPQVLAMARRLWKRGAALPRSWTQLFLEFFQVATRTLPPEVRDELLPRLALYMTRRLSTSIRSADLEEDAAAAELRVMSPSLAPLRGPGQSDAECLLAVLAKTRLLRGPHAFSFPSQALQEFLAALALRSVHLKEVLDLIPAAEWVLLPSIDDRPHNLRRSAFHGVVPFLSGLSREAAQLIVALVDRDLLLAAQCFREAQQAKAVAPLLRQRIERNLAGSEALGQRVACLCLEAVADGWAVGLLEQAASDSAFSARSLALSALGSLQSAKSLSLIKAATSDSDPGVAQAAMQALARFKVG